MKKLLLMLVVIFLAAEGAYYLLSPKVPTFKPGSLEDRVMQIARQYQNEDVVVVSKTHRLLYYFDHGQIVKNFPVPVSLGVNRWFPTPEGKFSVYTKNEKSRYTLFLGFKGLYGIHGGETYKAKSLALKEKLNPNYRWVTLKDGTRGCVAVETRVIKYLYSKIDVGTPVYIF